MKKLSLSLLVFVIQFFCLTLSLNAEARKPAYKFEDPSKVLIKIQNLDDACCDALKKLNSNNATIDEINQACDQNWDLENTLDYSNMLAMYENCIMKDIINRL